MLYKIESKPSTKNQTESTTGRISVLIFFEKIADICISIYKMLAKEQGVTQKTTFLDSCLLTPKSTTGI